MKHLLFVFVCWSIFLVGSNMQLSAALFPCTTKLWTIQTKLEPYWPQGLDCFYLQWKSYFLYGTISLKKITSKIINTLATMDPHLTSYVIKYGVLRKAVAVLQDIIFVQHLSIPRIYQSICLHGLVMVLVYDPMLGCFLWASYWKSFKHGSGVWSKQALWSGVPPQSH